MGMRVMDGKQKAKRRQKTTSKAQAEPGGRQTRRMGTQTDTQTDNSDRQYGVPRQGMLYHTRTGTEGGKP